MDILIPSGIIKGTLSGKIDKYNKAKIQRLNSNGVEVIQLSKFTEKQVFHTNCDEDSIKKEILESFGKEFKIMELYTTEYVYMYKISSSGKLLTNKRKNKEILTVSTHNKKKNYLLEEGVVVPPLVDLGVMMADGRVVKANYDKFKQINRFLEIVNDSIASETSLSIIDFGCGKSYLTFILYYYLSEVKHIECNIIGLDLKDDVIDFCNKLAIKYNYSNLKFYKGDIADFIVKNKVDMIVTLHACDTATDFALYHAIKNKCRYIFSVPCCQHELNNQMTPDNLHLINKFGLLKERFSAILTDAVRANLLQAFGYKTQVLEFVDFDASPKNVLIRASLTNNKFNEKIKDEIEKTLKEYNVEHTLYNLLFK